MANGESKKKPTGLIGGSAQPLPPPGSATALGIIA